jgi:hypothetical protein
MLYLTVSSRELRGNPLIFNLVKFGAVIGKI